MAGKFDTLTLVGGQIVDTTVVQAGSDRLKRQAPGEIAVPMFRYKNHVGIDREHGGGA